jgi:transposase
MIITIGLVPHKLAIDASLAYRTIRDIVTRITIAPMKKYKVTLSKDERIELNVLLKKERMAVRKRIHAQILLRADESDKRISWRDVDIAVAYGVSIRTVERVRERFVEQGFEAALQPRAPQENYARKFDGEKEAKLITLACSEAPEGYARWTLQLLADKMVELKYMESISHQAVRGVLKKTNLNLG